MDLLYLLLHYICASQMLTQQQPNLALHCRGNELKQGDIIMTVQTISHLHVVAALHHRKALQPQQRNVSPDSVSQPASKRQRVRCNLCEAATDTLLRE